MTNQPHQHEASTSTHTKTYRIKREQLPISCPMPDAELWNAHPRVFIPLDKTDHESCPYCSAVFQLVE